MLNHHLKQLFPIHLGNVYMRNKCVFSTDVFRMFASTMRLALPLLVVLFLLQPSARAAVITLVPTSSTWKYFIGTSEASSPDTAAWRTVAFNHSSWSEGLAPIG